MATMTIIKYLVAIVIMTTLINNKATSAQNCSTNDLVIGQSKTGRMVQEKTEWKVLVTNNCGCAIRFIQVTCLGWKTTEPVDRETFRPVGGGRCLLIGGGPLLAHASATFNYAWDPSFNFVTIQATPGNPCVGS